jgi:hypothetical protein
MKHNSNQQLGTRGKRERRKRRQLSDFHKKREESIIQSHTPDETNGRRRGYVRTFKRAMSRLQLVGLYR